MLDSRRTQCHARSNEIALAGPSGFTLLELLIVLAIMGIASAIALPRIRTMVMHQHVDRATQVVASDFRSAFTSSARGRIPVRVTIPPGATAYAVTNVATGDTIIHRDLASGDLSVAGMTGSVTTLDVFPNGVASSSDTVTISGPSGYTRRISVSRVGFVRVLP